MNLMTDRQTDQQENRQPDRQTIENDYGQMKTSWGIWWQTDRNTNSHIWLWYDEDCMMNMMTDIYTDKIWQNIWQTIENDRETDRYMYRQTDKQINRWLYTDRQTNIQTDKQNFGKLKAALTDWQKDRQTAKQTDRPTKLWYDNDCMMIMMMMMPIKVCFVYRNPGQNLMLYSHR